MPPPPRGPVEEETYDACEIEQQEDEFEQGDVEDEVEEESEEEEEDLPPPPQEELIQEDTYEFVPGEAMTAEPTHPVPPVPPSLPSRPAPSRPMHRDASPEPVPERPAANKTKKVSGDGAVMLGISQNELANKLNRLKKISTSENSEPPPKQEVQKQETAPVGSSFQQRMALFKTAEKGKPSAGKPLLPVKPTIVTSPPQHAVKPMEKPVTPVVERKITPAPAPPPPQPPAQEWEQDDVYDDASSYVDGTFLVRKSKQGGDKQPYTLVVLYQSHVYNLKVRVRDDNQVALGEWKDDELFEQIC
ncbi:BLNK-like protein [Mya arenaria]|uniref:BLNK-like protein n=1 Tax=Mya arenaria TaxID=6604 RepID=A0ABY7FKU8_MYAAR|nr:BLNK-like protein [Mya arenaria]